MPSLGAAEHDRGVAEPRLDPVGEVEQRALVGALAAAPTTTLTPATSSRLGAELGRASPPPRGAALGRRALELAPAARPRGAAAPSGSRGEPSSAPASLELVAALAEPVDRGRAR